LIVSVLYVNETLCLHCPTPLFLIGTFSGHPDNFTRFIICRDGSQT